MWRAREILNHGRKIFSKFGCLALTHRSEFASVIQRDGFEELLRILRIRTSTHADLGHQLLRSGRTPRIALPASILVSPDASKLNIVLRQ